MNAKVKAMPLRLVDIAALAGVSRITVSKVLLGTGGANTRVSAATRKKIQAIAAAANYRPNMAARMLTGKGSGIIGAIIDSEAPAIYFDCLRHMEKAVAEKGYRLMIAQQHENVDSIFAHAMDFSAYGAEGVISFAHGYPELKDQITEFMRCMPNVVYIGKPDLKNAALVKVDIESGVRALLGHLLQKGRKRLGIFLADLARTTIRQRYNGYRQALRAAGMALDESLVLIDDVFKRVNDENVEKIINRLVINNKVDAIVAQNDLFAARIISSLLKKGYRVPGDVAVTGFDDQPFAEAFIPAITTVRQPIESVAREAVGMLHEMISGVRRGRSISIKPELIVRESA